MIDHGLDDIKNHKFEDGDIENACPAMGGRVFLNFTDGSHVQLCKSDVEALAVHCGLINK